MYLSVQKSRASQKFSLKTSLYFQYWNTQLIFLRSCILATAKGFLLLLLSFNAMEVYFHMKKRQMCTLYFFSGSLLWQNFSLWMTFVPWIEIYFHTHHREQSVHIVKHTSFLWENILSIFSLNSDFFSLQQIAMFTFLCKHKFSLTEVLFLTFALCAHK